jgi:aldehyde dehydrogenase (NAD+)
MASRVIRIKEQSMRIIDRIYIGGEFVQPHGAELFDLHNPATGEVIGQVRLGDEEDTRRAIAAAKRAFPSFSRTSKEDRLAMLRKLSDVVARNADALTAAEVQEYGGPVTAMVQRTKYVSQSFLEIATALEGFEFTRRIRSAEVVMEPIGVVGIITPWNANALLVANKLATAIAAGCTAVLKPSEMSALQTQVLTEALHEAGLPPGVFNIVTGRGDVVGAELSSHPDIAKVSFTGSTVVGKAILRAGVGTLKRVTLELGGKSPTVILDDADFKMAMPLAVAAGTMNSGQACIAGTRILVPESRLKEASALAVAAMEALKVGDPRESDTRIGPMVSEKQYQRVQRYIRLGIEEGAKVLTGGEGHPHGLGGYFVKPTLFANVTNGMTIARDEIFGPVLCLLTYRTEEEAIAIANDTVYGLQAYVISSNPERARAVAARIQAGRVLVNGILQELQAPFGGFKQSGIGRELGTFGIEAHLEPKTILSRVA